MWEEERIWKYKSEAIWCTLNEMPLPVLPSRRIDHMCQLNISVRQQWLTIAINLLQICFLKTLTRFLETLVLFRPQKNTNYIQIQRSLLQIVFQHWSLKNGHGQRRKCVPFEYNFFDGCAIIMLILFSSVLLRLIFHLRNSSVTTHY